MKETRDRILPKGVGVLDGGPDKPRVRAGDAYAVRTPLEVLSADESERQYGRKLSGSSTRSALTTVLVVVAAQALNGAGLMRLLPAYILAYGVKAVVELRLPQGSPQSFVSCALRIAGVCLNLYVGLVSLPAALRESLPTPLAHGLPAFLVALIFYWVPPFYPAGRRREFWKWLIGAAAFAVLWGWFGPHLGD